VLLTPSNLYGIIIIIAGVMGVLSWLALCNFPRNKIMAPEASKYFDTYKNVQPPRKYLSRFGRIIENTFYLCGGVVILCILLWSIEPWL